MTARSTGISKNYGDEGFRKTWVDKKELYTRPPALDTVQWNFVEWPQEPPGKSRLL
jgi:hypothetical protein